jgi:hypothetical protein
MSRLVVAFSLPIAGAIACGSTILHAHRVPMPAQGPKKTHPGTLIQPNAGNKLPPSPVETPTTFTFYENTDRTGASYSVQIIPPIQVQATRLVPSTTLGSAGLVGKVSAVRIQCGTRPSRAALFDVDWSQFSDGTSIDCLPGQTTDVRKGGNHVFRRFRAKWLRKQRAPEDLIRFWLGHGGNTVTDRYVTIADEKGWRKIEAEKAGVGFMLPTSVVPIVPKVHKIRAIENAA